MPSGFQMALVLLQNKPTRDTELVKDQASGLKRPEQTHTHPSSRQLEDATNAVRHGLDRRKGEREIHPWLLRHGGSFRPPIVWASVIPRSSHIPAMTNEGRVIRARVKEIS